MSAALSIRLAGAGDLPFIMATERLPGYDRVVGRWTAEEHQAALARSDHAYLLVEQAGVPVGFAILMDLEEPAGNARLKRIAVAAPGGGVGRWLLAALTDWVFARPAVHRLWFNVVEGNHRAFHVYRSSGFVQEGTSRQAFIMPDGARGDLWVMSMLRPEWQARRVISPAVT